MWRSRSSGENDTPAPLAVVAIGKGSYSITSRQPPVKTRAACAARVCHSCVGALVDVSTFAARRATCGGILSVNYPRLSPRRETDVVSEVYTRRGSAHRPPVWI